MTQEQIKTIKGYSKELYDLLNDAWAMASRLEDEWAIEKYELEQKLKETSDPKELASVFHRYEEATRKAQMFSDIRRQVNHIQVY